MPGAAAQTGGDGARPIEAVKSGERLAALALLEAGAEANATSPDGTTALHWATRNNDAMLVDRLLRAGADVREKLHRSEVAGGGRGHSLATSWRTY